jgi:hypothetical protein
VHSKKGSIDYLHFKAVHRHGITDITVNLNDLRVFYSFNIYNSTAQSQMVICAAVPYPHVFTPHHDRLQPYAVSLTPCQYVFFSSILVICIQSLPTLQQISTSTTPFQHLYSNPAPLLQSSTITPIQHHYSNPAPLLQSITSTPIQHHYSSPAPPLQSTQKYCMRYERNTILNQSSNGPRSRLQPSIQLSRLLLRTFACEYNVYIYICIYIYMYIYIYTNKAYRYRPPAQRLPGQIKS